MGKPVCVVVANNRNPPVIDGRLVLNGEVRHVATLGIETIANPFQARGVERRIEIVITNEQLGGAFIDGPPARLPLNVPRRDFGGHSL